MSYILDALKKAESERKMGGVPDLHAQPVSSPAQAERAPGLGRALAIGAAVVALAAIALAWTKPWQARRAEPQVSAAAAPAQAVAAPQPPLAAPVPPQAPAPATAAIQPPAPVPAAPAQPQAASAGKLPAERMPPPKPVEPKLAKAAPPAPTAAAAPAQPAGAPAEARIPEFGELPEAVRREIPAFAFGGYLYSNNAADRTVLVNNRLLHEGDQIAPGLTLEKMMPKEAVLNYQGIRYRMAY